MDASATNTTSADVPGNTAERFPVDDAELMSALQQKLIGAGASDVEITVADGLVTLQGSVRTNEERAMVEKAVKNTPGAGTVVDQLTVRPMAVP